MTADGRTLFFNSTRHAGRPWATLNSDSTRYDDDIYYMQRRDTGTGGEQWSEPINLGLAINTSGDDGVVSINPTGDVLYFCSLKKNFEDDGGPFYYAKQINDQWGEIKGMGGGLTRFFMQRNKSRKFLIYGASINAGGTAFYFATTLHSLQGVHEIWVSIRDSEENEWGYPRNLGNTINREGGSYAPFIAADDRTLYFASGRKGGFGGDDLYMTTAYDTRWNLPTNLGPTINTRGNDAFLSIPASGDRMYYINGDGGGICGVPLPEQVRPVSVLMSAGLVSDRENGNPLVATVNVNDSARVQTRFQTRSSRQGRFTLLLKPGRTYDISVNAPGYLPERVMYAIPQGKSASPSGTHFRITRFQDPERNILTNIYFDYNSDTLNSEALPEIRRMGQLLDIDTSIMIEIRGHTDNVGSAVYNRKLSKRRAETVWRSLVSLNPVHADRVRLVGLGAAQPKESNTTALGRQRNRRVEVKLVGNTVQHAERIN